MKRLFPAIIALMLLVTLLWGPSCANIVPPAGGPRDSLPPRLLRVSPPDSTLNFNSDRIIFEFDEYVDLQDVPANVLFTPTFERNPEIAVKGRTITVRFRDMPEPNTTYRLEFGNALRDINEANILRGFNYSFSTGPVMDTLEIRGRVILAENGRVDSTLVVVLHRDLEDSAVRNKRPPYVTRVDAQGNFRFTSLPAGDFAIYAIGNAGVARRYQNNSQLFAFLDRPVNAAVEDSAIVMYAYREAPALPPLPPLNVGGRGTGSGGNRDRLTFTTSISANQQDLMKDLVLSFPVPVRNIDSSRIGLFRDSSFQPVPFNLVSDTGGRSLAIRTQWMEDRPYHLVLDRDFASDSLGRKLLKTDTVSFRTRKEADYGNVRLRIKGLEQVNNPVLQFVQNNEIILSVPIGSGTFTASRFVPGEYELRILEDRNQNGKWDPGNFFGEKRQPELVRPIERRITVKANWDNEFEVGL